MLKYFIEELKVYFTFLACAVLSICAVMVALFIGNQFGLIGLLVYVSILIVIYSFFKARYKYLSDLRCQYEIAVERAVDRVCELAGKSVLDMGKFCFHVEEAEQELDRYLNRWGSDAWEKSYRKRLQNAIEYVEKVQHDLV